MGNRYDSEVTWQPRRALTQRESDAVQACRAKLAAMSCQFKPELQRSRPQEAPPTVEEYRRMDRTLSMMEVHFHA